MNASFPACASPSGSTSPGEEASCNTIEDFYTMGCPHCFKANIFLEQLQKEYPDIFTNHYNVADIVRSGQHFFQ
ncbi:MAG TPA: thioredoxin family protein [Gammaproteobacteria bacterium]|nr:thioredoxin family protein [Gammaproteobacteria bacterium]